MIHQKKESKNKDGYIPAGEGLRHIALISLGFKEAKILIKKHETLNSNSLYQKLINSDMIEDMKEYKKDNEKHQELESIVDFIINHVDSDISFGQDYLQSKNENRFVHILENSVDEQFNTWYWTGKGWSENTQHFILEKLLPLKSEEFKPNRNMAVNISNNISASDLTLKISLDKEYSNKMMKYIINSKGQYFDLKKGLVKNVDPSFIFYKNAQFDLDFDMDIKEPKKFFEFIKERYYENDRDIVTDHLASVFLHTSILGSKPKMLYIQGNIDTYKSLVIEILKKMITITSISMESNENIADKFGLSLIGDKILNYSEEQNAIETKDPASLKNAVTMESAFTTPKFGKKPIFISRYPRHIVMCNKIAPIAKDDNDDSIFVRNQYVQTKQLTQDTPNWRKEILNDDKEIQKIFMFLLKRASEIFNGSKCKMQTINETKKRYLELTQGSIQDFFKKRYSIEENYIGTNFMYVFSDFKDFTNNNISNKAFRNLITEQGLEITKERAFRTKENNVFNQKFDNTNENDMNARPQPLAIWGIKPNIIANKSQIDNSIKSNNGLKF